MAGPTEVPIRVIGSNHVPVVAIRSVIGAFKDSVRCYLATLIVQTALYQIAMKTYGPDE